MSDPLDSTEGESSAWYFIRLVEVGLMLWGIRSTKNSLSFKNLNDLRDSLQPQRPLKDLQQCWDQPEDRNIQMTQTKTRINHKGTASADSRPKGGNAQQPLQDHQYRKALETYIQSQWNNQQPDWFITVQWTPAPYTFEQASHHARHFRNIFLTSIYSCSLKKLPRPEDRCRLIWFHERAQDPKGRLIYHSHLHLIGCPLTI